MNVARLGMLLVALASGCATTGPNTQRGTAIGGLLGAGAGAIIGHQTGDAGAGALIGAGLGALGGAAVGDSLDEMAAENRAAIAAQMGRQVTPGAATPDEVIAMTRAGVSEQLIVNYVRTSGVTQTPTTADVIYLHQQGVATPVIAAMQTPTPPPQAPIQERVIVEEHHYGPPVMFGPPCHPCGPSVGVGFSFGG